MRYHKPQNDQESDKGDRKCQPKKSIISPVVVERILTVLNEHVYNVKALNDCQNGRDGLEVDQDLYEGDFGTGRYLASYRRNQCRKGQH